MQTLIWMASSANMKCDPKIMQLTIRGDFGPPKGRFRLVPITIPPAVTERPALRKNEN